MRIWVVSSPEPLWQSSFSASICLFAPVGGIGKVWDLALDNSANVLALNVIECAASTGTLIQRRDKLNELIAAHAQDRW